MSGWLSCRSAAAPFLDGARIFPCLCHLVFRADADHWPEQRPAQPTLLCKSQSHEPPVSKVDSADTQHLLAAELEEPGCL